MGDQITVLVGRCTIRINLDPFFNRTTPLTRQKKVLNFVFQEPQRNEGAISILDVYLPQKRAEADEAWATASKRYRDGYISTKFHHDLTAQQKRTVEAANHKMLSDVKRRKSDFARWSNIVTYYGLLKTKNHF